MVDLIMSRIAYLLTGFLFMLAYVLLIDREWVCSVLLIFLCSIILIAAVIEDLKDIEYRRHFFEVNAAKRWLKRCG